MKKLLQILIFTLLTLSLKAQTATSITNGNWTNPLTWNCTCVPVNGYSVTINNSVTLNSSLLFNTGGITINNTGSLMQDATPRDIWINGGYFYNHGKADFRYFLVSVGTSSNSGTFTISAFTNSVNFVNQGTIDMDSMWIAAPFTNSFPGKIIGDSLTVASTLINNNKMMITATTNSGTVTNNNYMDGYAYTNSGIFYNNDSLILTGSIWNRTRFINNTGAKVRLTKNFHNYHPSNTASFNNNGNVTVLDSWYNTDTVKGNSSGYFQVQDTSANSGTMGGNFTFCDLTPPPTFPKIDLNSGPVSLGITFCVSGGINEKELAESKIYPNPSGKVFNIKSDIIELGVMITDVSGRIVLEKTIPSGDNAIELNYADGVYFVKLTDKQSGRSVTKRLVIQN